MNAENSLPAAHSRPGAATVRERVGVKTWMERYRRAIIVAALFSSTGLSTPRRSITVGEASQLVSALLKPDGWTKLRGFTLYQALFDAEFQDFYFIHAEWDSPAGRHAAIGHFAVERTTGEVWDWVKCGQFNSPSLSEAQQTLRKRIGLTDPEFQQIKKPGPFCEPNEKPQALKMGRPKPK